MGNKGQSLVEMIFAITTVVLVLTGVVILIVNTAKAKQTVTERQKATELSQMLVEKQISIAKNDSKNFWSGVNGLNGEVAELKTDIDYPGYTYTIGYSNCTDAKCTIIFTIHWGDDESLSVERFFSKQGL